MIGLSLAIGVHNLFLALVVVLFIVLALIGFVLIYGFYRYRVQNRINVWTRYIDMKITEAIVNGSHEDLDESVFNRLMKRSSFRSLFLERLVESEKNFSGVAHVEIRNLFVKYQLHLEALKRLNQRKSYMIIGGIQELTAMEAREFLPEIERFLHYKYANVYHEAQYAMVALKGFEGFSFLKSFSKPISDWQQLRLLNSIANIPDTGTEQVMEWLDSQNITVVVFTLKLIRKFQLFTFYDRVKECLDHKEVKVRVQAVRTLQTLEGFSTLDDLIESYDSQPQEIQLEIVKVLKAAKDSRFVEFFKTQLSNHTLASIRIIAAEALIALGLKDYLSELIGNQETSEELILIVKHAMQVKRW